MKGALVVKLDHLWRLQPFVFQGLITGVDFLGLIEAADLLRSTSAILPVVIVLLATDLDEAWVNDDIAVLIAQLTPSGVIRLVVDHDFRPLDPTKHAHSPLSALVAGHVSHFGNKGAMILPMWHHPIDILSQSIIKLRWMPIPG